MVKGTWQRNLIPCLEGCWKRQLVRILELVQIEKFVCRPVRRFGRKELERQAIARAFVGKAVYDHPTTWATLEALRTASIWKGGEVPQLNQYWLFI
jgi:hypothetical protein